MSSLHFFVGSTNKVKTAAVEIAVSQLKTEYEVVSIASCEVESGVSAQPMTDEETRKGAQNRARAAFACGCKEHKPEEVMGVGLEGGVFMQGDEMWSTVWVVFCDSNNDLYEACGMRVKVPQEIAQVVLSGLEMADAMETLIGEKDVRSKQGVVGVVTKLYVNRTEEYAAIAKLACGLWYGRDWNK